MQVKTRTALATIAFLTTVAPGCGSDDTGSSGSSTISGYGGASTGTSSGGSPSSSTTSAGGTFTASSSSASGGMTGSGGAATTSTGGTGGDATTGTGGAGGSGGTPCSDTANYKAALLADHPVGYWPFDEAAGATTVADASGVSPSHPGSVNGGVTLGIAGAITGGTAASFDGTSGFIDMGDSYGFAPDAPFSVEFWLRPTELATDYTGIVTKEDDIGGVRNGYLIFLNQMDNQVGFERWGISPNPNAGPSGGVKTAPPALNAWTHVVCTFDLNNAADPMGDNVSGPRVRVYYDGVFEDANWSDQAMAVTTKHFVVGARLGGATGFTKGDIDDVSVYDYALTSTQVKAHYAAASSCP